MIRTISRILAAIIAVVMVGAYFYPIWSIQLEAPQYPEGLGMTICINDIRGDVKTINGLNHYIGMKNIEPDSFSELAMMPYILGVLIALGLATAITGNKKLLLVWGVVFIVAGIAGGVDFYTWEYNYGHDLNPHAAIKIPGMAYQPPLWGSKALLNFTAHSYPAVGGAILIGAGIAVAVLMMGELFLWKKSRALAVAVVLLALGGSACSYKPEPLRYGHDACEHCKMTLVDQRFGAELITDKGKVLKFDAVECLVQFMDEKNIQKNFHSIWAVDFSTPGTLLDASQCVYYKAQSLPSPMGMYLTAHKGEEQLQPVAKQHKGETLTWMEMYAYVQAGAPTLVQ